MPHPWGTAKGSRGTIGSSDGKQRGWTGRWSDGRCWVFRAPAIQQGFRRDAFLQPWPEWGTQGFRGRNCNPGTQRLALPSSDKQEVNIQVTKGDGNSVEHRHRLLGCARRVSFHPHWLSTLQTAGPTPGPGTHPQFVPKSVAWPQDSTQCSSNGVPRIKKRKISPNPQEQYRKAL